MIDYQNAVDMTYEIGDNYFLSPAEQGVKKMLYLVAYDVCRPRRLRKVAKICEDFGIRVEKSVFECDLSEDSFTLMWKLLTDVIHPDFDALVAYKIGGCCISKTKSLGVFQRPKKPLYYIF